MKVIHLVPSIFDENSGPSYSVTRTCELLNNNLDIELLTLSKKSIPGIFENIKKMQFHKQFDIDYGIKKFGISSKLSKYIKYKIDKNKVDIIHSHAMWHILATYPGNLLKNNNYKIVISPRGTFSKYAFAHKKFIKQIFWNLFLYPAINKSHCFHATSYQEYLDIRRLGFKQPVAIIPNGVDIKKNIKSIKSPKRNIIFLGRIHKLKGLENLLYAWKKINFKYKDWQLKIIGTDVGYKKRSNYLRKLKLLSQKLKLINIDFVDPIYGNEKFQTLADAQIMILPSFTENFGMTVAEALSVGTPVITTNQTPWHQLDSKNAGWCIDIGVEATINCLEEALSKNVDELNEMGTRGIEWMQQDFSWPTIINKLILTYGWLNDKKKKKCEWIKID